MSYEDALAGVREEADRPHLLLGNGFSIAFDYGSFSYGALAAQARDKKHLSGDVVGLMHALGTDDFESTMQALIATTSTLAAIDADKYRDLIDTLNSRVEELRDALAQAVAGLHPLRPAEISDDRYRSVRRFLKPALVTHSWVGDSRRYR